MKSNSIQRVRGVATSFRPSIEKEILPIVPPPYSRKPASWEKNAWHQPGGHHEKHFMNPGNKQAAPKEKSLLISSSGNNDETCAEEGDADVDADSEGDETDDECERNCCHGAGAYDDLPELGIEFSTQAVTISSTGIVSKEPLRHVAKMKKNGPPILSYEDMEALQLDRPDLAFDPLEKRKFMQQART